MCVCIYRQLYIVTIQGYPHRMRLNDDRPETFFYNDPKVENICIIKQDICIYIYIYMYICCV